MSDSVYQLTVVREYNEKISESLWEELLIFTNSKGISGAPVDHIKETLRTEFIYPAIDRLIGDDDFPHITEETAKWDKTKSKNGGEYKVSILNKVHGVNKQHPYFAYESTIVNAADHAISLYDMNGHYKSYSVLRGELKAAAGKYDNLFSLRKDLEKVKKTYIKTRNISQKEADDLVKAFGDFVDKEMSLF